MEIEGIPGSWVTFKYLGKEKFWMPWGTSILEQFQFTVKLPDGTFRDEYYVIQLGEEGVWDDNK